MMRTCTSKERYIQGVYLKRRFVYGRVRKKNESKFTLLILYRLYNHSVISFNTNKVFGALCSPLRENLDPLFDNLFVFCLLDFSGDREELSHNL